MQKNDFKKISDKIKQFFIDFLNTIKTGCQLWLESIKCNINKSKVFLKEIHKFTIFSLNQIKDYLIFLYNYFLINPDQREKLKIFLFDEHTHYIELINLIKIKLENMRSVLAKDIDFDKKDLERLDDLIIQAEKLIELIEQKGLTEKDFEYQKIAKSFFSKLYRLHDKLYSVREFQFLNIVENKKINKEN
jgi:Cu2+-containing amine oxidase